MTDTRPAQFSDQLTFEGTCEVQRTYEHMREGAAEEGAVDCSVPTRLWAVDVLAARAKELDGLLERLVGQADGKKRLLVAQDPWAATKIGTLVLFELLSKRDEVNGEGGGGQKKGFGTYHLCESARRDDVPGMDETVQQPSLRLDVVSRLIVQIVFCSHRCSALFHSIELSRPHNSPRASVTRSRACG